MHSSGYTRCPEFLRETLADNWSYIFGRLDALPDAKQSFKAANYSTTR